MRSRLPRRVWPAVLLLFALTAAVAPADGGFEKADAAVNGAMASDHIPGAAFVVARGGAIVHARGFGFADRDSLLPMQPDSLFTLASVSKVLTGIAVMQLVESKALSLDARAYDFFPGLEAPAGTTRDPRLATITVRELLLHAGGWDRRASGDIENEVPKVRQALHLSTATVSALDVIRYSLGVPLDFTPGTKQVYSNLGYIILSEIVTRVSGEPYETYVREHVLAPAGVTEGSLHHDSGVLPGEVARYLPTGTRFVPPLRPQSEGAGDWVLAAPDMVRVVLALESGKLLSRASYDAMFAPPRPPLEPRPNGTYFGYGWDIVRHAPDGVRYAKDGGLPGIRTWLEHRADGTVFALFFNGGSDDPGMLGRAARAVDDAL